ncbi:DUF2591 family protein [Citrobacter sp. RHBSTW-00599]|uniref:phage protein NinX family protein n=1 Tax=Citrobacter sp. RHBSTW-00599 TaxID=2742657 RepID=UPI0015EA5479|nr:phage protein NinX family protein [Citrobacter sp. RHBSTW-00599]QLY02282.1 DUF2591 family protein [Citrobacter sp. RHBSTW-00599]
MDYSKLSDHEINVKVGTVIGFVAKLMAVNKQTDYCNNPVDAWPIIVGKKLSIINADNKWLCVPEDEPVNGVTGDAVHMIYSGDGVEHENPLRAAMIVFLMMQDSANVPANSTGSDLR